jgi:hypothetical protein
MVCWRPSYVLVSHDMRVPIATTRGRTAPAAQETQHMQLPYVVTFE